MTKQAIKASIPVILAFFIITEALSYIPSSDFILKEVLKNHGRSNYLIQQELTFPIEKTQKVVLETWYITVNKNQDLQLHLLATSEGLHIERLYTNNRVYHKDNKKSLKKNKWSLEFIEPWFIGRSLQKLQNTILNHKMAEASTLNWNPSLFVSSSKTKFEENKKSLSHVQMPINLSINQGQVMYAYQKNAKGPGLWIEQDKFVIRKIKLKTSVEVLASRYIEHVGYLKFPQHRVLIYEDTSIPIKTINISRLSDNKKLQQKLSLQNFRKSQKNTTQWGESETSSLIRDFYSRFR